MNDDDALARRIYAQAVAEGVADFQGIKLDLRRPGRKLVVSCAGVVQPGQVLYATTHTLEEAGGALLLVTDSSSLWYQFGIPSLTGSFEATIGVLAALVALIAPQDSCVLGTSSGGYMALALAARLGLKRALALSPQTSIGVAPGPG